MTEFQKAMAVLDMSLTGKVWTTIVQTARNANIDPERLLFGPEHAYYLSDGGYSRIMARCDDTGRIMLSSNSRNEVKARWDDSADLVADVQRHLIDYLATLV